MTTVDAPQHDMISVIRRILGGPMGSAKSLFSAIKLLWSEADGLTTRLFTLTICLVLGSAIVAALAPVLLKVVVDGLALHASHPYHITYLVLAYAITHWLARSLTEIRGLFHGKADVSIQRRLSAKLFEHVMSLPLRFHLDRKTGALSQTLTNGLLGYRMVLNHLVLTVTPVVIEIATMSAVLLFLDHVVFLAIISMSVLFYATAFWIGVIRIGNPARAASSAHIDTNAILTDSILNYETVKYFGAEQQVYRRVGDALAETELQWNRLYKRKMENGLVIATIFTVSLGVSIYLAAQAVQQGNMSMGEFILVNAYILQITRPLEMIGFAFRDIAQGMAFIEQMACLFDQRREVDTTQRHASLPAGPPELVFDHVSYSYLPGRCVLRSVNFAIPAGKTVAIVGASGSGKSSLIRLLVRMMEPTSGQIYLNGAPLSDIPMSTLRKAIAVVPQDIALFNDSIAYNIGFGRWNSTNADIVKAAKLAHIHDFITELPNGYDTEVGEKGLKLSGGEKQRLAIARAAIKRPKVFVFDEATSSLDSTTERAILDGFIKVARETTTLIIAHRLSTVVHANEIVVLEHGIVVERGTHGELLRHNGSYAAMWRAQTEQSRHHEKYASRAS